MGTCGSAAVTDRLPGRFILVRNSMNRWGLLGSGLVIAVSRFGTYAGLGSALLGRALWRRPNPLRCNMFEISKTEPAYQPMERRKTTGDNRGPPPKEGLVCLGGAGGGAAGGG